MKKHILSKTLILIIFTQLVALFGTEKKPDIVFILLDDLRYDAMSFMDHPYIQTPNMDQLRARGAWIKNAFVTTSICCPSRASFLTGTYASRHGVIDNETAEYDPEITPPVSMYLQEVGYKTAMIGKWHMGYSGSPRKGFDHWLSFEGQGVYNNPTFNINGVESMFSGYTTDLLTDHAIEFIKEQDKEKPYFLMLSHKAVHEPFRPAIRHKKAFGEGLKDQEPLSFSSDFKGKPLWQRRQRVEDVRWHWRTKDREQESIPERIAQEDFGKRSKYVDQLRCAAAVDEGIGKILETLKKRGSLENTLIVFSSDNGYFHGEHRRWDKRLAYEESLRIPMLISYPKLIAENSTVDGMVNNIDFAPTILEYAGIRIPEQMQGLSIKPLLEGEKESLREEVFYEYWTELVHSIPTMTALRTDRIKLISFPELEDIDELYDLEKDPHEMTNLVQHPEYSSVYESMKKRLQTKIQEVGWRADVFPHNLERFRGERGTLFQLTSSNGKILDGAQGRNDLSIKNVEWNQGAFVFDGQSSITVPFSKTEDPSQWPFHLEVEFYAEKDGVLAFQASKGYGFKLFVEEGRPGVSTLAKTWVATTTTIDAVDTVIGEWAHVEILIDYNRLSMWLNGELVDTMALPLPLKHYTHKPLLIGSGNTIDGFGDLPKNGFEGKIKNFSISRKLKKPL